MKDIGKDRALLEAYASLWNNRKVMKGDEEPLLILSELVRRELLDENAHPRARKPIHEKFHLSVNRVMESSLTDEEKTALISVYCTVQERILALK
ncbi:hypothetical protein ACQKL5_14810 [Peribacillus sp. NPDC097675]|uniref:hypothetical protein n=1 Tax=Peribacillus sp. NPDC097675 TaxID=3390618 RepID=UPI003D055986